MSEVPVICPNIHTPALARKIIAEGQVDMVSLSRSLIADPDWPNKVHNGREDQIQKCIRCNSCISNLYRLFGTRCVVNPSVGKERFISQYHPPVLKKSEMKERSHPLKGLSREKTPLHVKKAILFHLTLTCVPARFRFPILVSHPLFRIYRLAASLI